MGRDPASQAVAPADTANAPGRIALLADHEIAVHQLGQWRIVWLRFRGHRLAVWAARFLLLVIAVAIVGPYVAPAFRVFHPPPSGIVPLLDHPPRLWPFDVRTLFGTDAGGFWISSYVLMGARATLVIGIGGSLLAGTIGCLFGGVAGYFGGVVDAVLMRVVDAFLTVPFLPFLMVLSIYLTNRSMLVYAALFGLVGWAGVARLIRSSVLSLREREFTEAARALGVSDAGVILRHVIPNTLDTLIVACTLNVAVFILADAALDFVGAGSADITWSSVMRGGGNVLSFDWWIYAFPGACILLTALSVNFMGDGLRDALDTSSSAPVIRRDGAAETQGAVTRSLNLLFRGPTLAAGAVVSAGGVLAGRVWAPARPERTRGELAPVELAAAGVRELARGRRAAFVLAPIVLLSLASGGVFLYGHSPLLYSPYYSAPVVQARAQDYAEYGAVAQRDGGWSLAVIDLTNRLEYLRTDAAGAIQQRMVLARNAQPSAEPSLAMHGSQGLAAWVSPDNRTIVAAGVGSLRSTPFPLGPVSAQVEHPYVVARPRGGYDVLFERGTGRGATYDIYLARVGNRGRGPVYLRRLTHAPDYTLYPRGVYDGSGALDVLYLNRPKLGYWNLTFQRLDAEGRSLSQPRLLDRLEYYMPLPSGGFDPTVIPDRWGIAMARAPDGSVWAGWDGDQVASVAHWNSRGKLTLQPSIVIPGSIEAASDTKSVRALALAATRNGGVLYHWAPGTQEQYMAAYGFNRSGQPAGPTGHRIDYSAGGSATDPHAATINGRPEVIWELIRGNGSGLLQSSVWHPYEPPDLATRLGLNIGTLYGNIAFVIFGSLAFGAAFAAINLLAIAVLCLLWFPLGSLLPRRFAWPAYAAALTLGLLWLFARHADPPSGILIISGLGSPYGLLAALSGGFVAWWSGRWFFARQDALFRAASMAVTGFYFVAVMYAVVFIEGQIGKI
jgi:ABC-type dipeptide/oligopeptide/nickel transport system permease subunit